MKKAMAVLIVVLLALLLFVELKASTLPKSLIPADAEWVVHLDMGKFKSSRIGELLLQEQKGGIKKKAKAFYKHTSIDLLKDINGITIYGVGTKKQQTVMCLEGTFDKKYLLSLLENEDTHRKIPHGEHIINKWNHTEYGLFVGENLVLLAWNEGAIKAALDTIDGKGATIVTSPLKSYADKIPADAFFAALVKDFSALSGYSSKTVILKKAGSGLFTLMEKDGTLNLRVKATTETPEDAKNMEQVIRGLIAMAQMQLEESYAELKLAKVITVSTDNNTINIELNHPSEEIYKIITGQKMNAILSMDEFVPLS
jgi:hypothetical protein